MSLFDLFRKKQPKSKESSQSYILAKHFKGFRALPVVIQGNQESEQNNEKMANIDLSGKTITFVPAVYDGNHKMYHVLVDNLKMGAIFDDDNMKRVKRIESVYAKMENETTVGKHGPEQRAKIRVFIKEVE